MAEETQKAFKKRDALVDLELRAQAVWEKNKVFDVDAPGAGEPLEPKFLATFPFPYMNGRLHLGHTFSLSKVEFAVAYERLKGKRALFPFGFHCTGMPIKACADKLKREVELFGPDFERYSEEEQQENEEPNAPAPSAEKQAKDDPTKIVKKHAKQAAKSTGLKYQFQIMRSMGIENSEIKKFVDPLHWLTFFPPIAIADLKRLGAHIDWRRTFITTDVNPYFDSFVRWQFNQLHQMAPSKVQFGERYTIYSPLDGQPCLDHDRASGEGLGVQEYTGIKLQVRLESLNATPVEGRDRVKDDKPVGEKLSSPAFVEALGGRKLFLVAATLRPETMYGQTNCYVGVDLNYGVYEVSDSEAWVCTERAARDMAFQSLFKEKGKIVKLADLTGWDLVGVPLSAPLSPFDEVYTLPMEGVLPTKGTGVVTSVPSNSPDDFITLQDLLKKPAYYHIQKKWVEPFMPPRPIIRTPNLGDIAAQAAIEKLKINSQKDKKQLAEAKELVYKEDFYQGTLLVGEHAGKPVQEAKPLIRKLLIDRGDAFAYCEPEGQIISRSGDECVVTLAAQWYMDYGEEKWRAQAKEALARMNTFGEETRNAFEKTLDWLGQWACSRSFGLGSRLPWDREWLIESLSDSTIYMAYYTVAHILQCGTLDGSKPGLGNIKPEQMTDEVWTYVLLQGPYPKNTKIAKETLETMRREFEFFYPVDLRCSGKDLINNHLTFFLYNHVAIFPKEKWPRGIRANGHLLRNGEKMSKSTGNSMSMREALDIYGADATRFALADSGDSVEDANFVEKTADDAILKLYAEKEWTEEVLAQIAKNELRTGPLSWNDRVFAAEMDSVIAQADAAYTAMLYRDALKSSFYDMQAARNEYRKAVTGQGINLHGAENEVFEGLHKDLVLRFIEVQALMMKPITPHWSEHIYSELLKKPTSVMSARWPASNPVDESVLAAATYIRELGSKIRSAEDAAAKKKTKKGGKVEATPEPEGPRTLRVYVATEFPEWQEQAMEILRQTWDDAAQKLNGTDKELLTKAGLIKDKRIMPFVAMIKKAVEASGKAALDRKLRFGELETLRVNLDFLRRDLLVLKVGKIELLHKEKLAVGTNGVDDEDIRKAEAALPGAPTYRIL
ncbi:cytosolic leucyl tRNA synthetase [Polyrhizophydium stewartii]|uniref:leucine--tRNA ligase n=1 Tax=Polyrhizophydium stewartii TaxID=2732419 RepID=A0ABR4N2L4_9FUNG